MEGSRNGDVLWDVEPSGVAWLTLNRPDAGNALTAEQRGVMLQLLEDAGNDVDVRAIVLTASGDRHFCTGGDLRVAETTANPPTPKRADVPEQPTGTTMRGVERHLGAQRFIAALQDCAKPIIAAVNGTAAGLGAHVAFACDLIVAADTARFIEIFARRGLIPDGGGPYLVTRLVGPQKAKELFFFGDDIPAEEALRLGLVNRIVPAADLREEVRAWAERLAAGPTVALGLTKRLVNAALDGGREAAFRAEALALEVSMQSYDSREGVKAFVERRPVEFTGW